MTGATDDAALGRSLTRLLSIGTWAASAVIAIGMLLGDPRITGASVVMCIGLPVVRVGWMLVAFVRGRDWRIAAIAAAVLLIIAAGLVIGLMTQRVAE